MNLELSDENATRWSNFERLRTIAFRWPCVCDQSAPSSTSSPRSRREARVRMTRTQFQKGP